jgi:hypothetical protein
MAAYFALDKEIHVNRHFSLVLSLL